MVNIAGSVIKARVSAYDLGVTLDQYLTMSTHVSNLCKNASFALTRIGNIREYLDQLRTENWFTPLCPLNLTILTVYCVVSLIKKSWNLAYSELSRSTGYKN